MQARSSGQPSAVVIGVGNPDRGDDGVGPAVAERLRKANLNGVEIVTVAGETTELLAAWSGADCVVVVDAMRSRAAPGDILRLDARRAPLPASFLCSTHAFGLAQAVELARVLNQLPPRLVVYGIEGASFEAGAKLTPAVADAVEEVARRVCGELHALARPRRTRRLHAKSLR